MPRLLTTAFTFSLRLGDKLPFSGIFMARTLRYILLLLIAAATGSTALAQANGQIYGVITDEKNEPIINAQVIVTAGGIQQGASITDFDGNYSVKPLAAGEYTVTVAYSGYKQDIVEGVIVSVDGGTRLNFQLEPATVVPDPGTTGGGTTTGGGGTTTGGGARGIGEVNVRARRYERPLFEERNVGSRTVLTAAEIEKMPTRNPLDAASTAPGVYQSRNGGGLSIGGGRGENTLYVVDGIVQIGSRGIASLPYGSVAQMSVITGGLPARYGDATGGVVAITTKGITSRTQGGINLEHSVDGYNNRRADFNVSGPLFSRRDSSGNRRPIVGYAVSGNFTNNQDANPSFFGTYVLKEDVRRRLEQTPVVAIPGTTGLPTLRNAAEFVRASDFEIVKRRPNAAGTNASLLGKFDFALGNNMNLTVGAQGFYGIGSNFSRGVVAFAPDAISESESFTGRGFVRFTQRFLQRAGDTTARTITNAFYSIQADYQKELNNTEDPRFGRDAFKYGYLGKFYQTLTPTYTFGRDSLTGRDGVRLNPGFRQTGARFERADLNPILANYTSTVFDIIGQSVIGQTDIRSLRQYNALLNGDGPTTLYGGLFSNIGSPIGGYSFSNNDQISVGVDASLDVRTRKIVHSLEFGLYYQQRTERNYGLSAAAGGDNRQQSLWERAYLLTNTHFDENLDYSNPIFVVNGQRYTREDVEAGRIIPSPSDTILYNYISRGNQTAFDRNLRTKLGLNPDGTDFINVYELDPSLLSVDMFSADELFNSGRSAVSYLGYDYTGNRASGNTSFNDFFTARDENGRFTRPIGAFRPNYIAGYISDNFKFRDVLFNLGVRVDRFDANTKTLIDPYSLYAVRTADQVNIPNRPANIGDKFVVYVDNAQSPSPQIAGYRDGDNFYTPSGELVDDPNFLKAFTGGRDPQPYLVNPQENITDSTFNPDNSFQDYEPQVNVMPRISLSFPIADQTLFYAHYNIVVQRPRFGNALSPLDYYFLTVDPTRIIANPNLLPERVTDYEVGFSQALNKTSAVTISAFYKERKDQIQLRPYLFAYPTTYYTFGNRDFSTTKGLRVKYDLRRVGPFQMLVSYTLQFAEGTGSDAADQNRGRTDRVVTNGLLTNFITAQLPNLRYPFALSYDSRHNIVVNADYRYFQGQGPELFGARPFQNAGANLIFRTRSGEPYTRYADPVSGRVQGGVNGSRLSWHYMVDLNVDKDIALRSTRRDNGDVVRATPNRRQLYIQAFCYVRNLLNTRDVLGVNGYSGRPDTDGFLASPLGQQAIQQQIDPQSYIDLYTISALEPGNINLPRQINVGVRLNF